MAVGRQSSGELKEVPPSILERLRSGGESQRSATDLRVDVDALREEVLEHVQALLNTRLAEIEGLDAHPEAQRSLLAYGVPDLSAFFHGSVGDVQRMIACIEKAIRTFEPRLDPKSVRVERVRDAAAEPVMKMRLRVQAVLRVHPFVAPVVFDTRVDADTASVTVHEVDA